MNSDIIFLPANEIVSRIKSKKTTVVEVINAFLNQIERFNPRLNAIIDQRDRGDILREAVEKDAEITNGKELGLLHGLPLTIKDSFLVKGMKNSNGDPLLRKYIADEDCELVRRLKAEGAIIIGKTNVPLYCIDWQSTNSWNGRTNNPYDMSRVAGGSSGGAAVAVSAGFSPLELAADVGGSVRVPAHFNGICGLRPTENYLSNRGHLKGPNKPQGRRHILTAGPLGKNVDDVMLMMNALGNNLKYRLPELPDIDFDKLESWDRQPLKIAVSPTMNGVEIDAEYLELFNNFIDKLRGENHQMKECHPAYDEKKAYVECSKLVGFEFGINNPKVPLLSTLIYAFIRLKYRDHLWAKGMALGQRLSNSKYARAIDFKDEFSGIYDDFLSENDVWITPVCAFEAYKHQRAGIPFTINGKKVGYTEAMASFNFTSAFSGHPIAVIPIGVKKNGMPVGVQIHARKWSDKRLLEIARYFEQFTDGFQAPEMVF